MYKVTVMINGDGDLSYKLNTLPNYIDGQELEVYFENRNDAGMFLRTIASQLSSTVGAGLSEEDYRDFERQLSTIAKLSKYIYLISTRIETFYLSFEYGNHSVEFAIKKVSKQTLDKGFTYMYYGVDHAFYISCDIENDYSWSEIEKIEIKYPSYHML